MGADETGAKVKGKKWWIGVWQNVKNTFLSASDNRGFATVEALFPEGLPKAIIGSDLNTLLAHPIIKKDFPLTLTFQKSMIKHRNHLFPCLFNLEVPPNNNASERTIRNVKVKQKISGKFKSGQDTFCTLRSIIDTLRKRELDVLFFLKKIMAT